MKKPYQIEAQRAVKQLEAMATDGNPAVQMMLPMAEMVGWLRKGVGELVRQAGLQLMELLMQEEVRELVGERSQQRAERIAAIEGFEARKRRIDEQIAQLRRLRNGHQPVAASTSEPQKHPRRKMSAATRKRMGEAQRKRRAAKSATGTATKTAAKPKRKLSAAGRAAIVAALKKRWALIRAAAKKLHQVPVRKAGLKKAVSKKAA